ncbi:MAG: sterol desaturase family protein [Myxococcota bacterium]
MGRRLAQWLIYPAFLCGSVALVLVLLRWLHPIVAMNLVNGLAGLALIPLERALPYEQSWLRSRGDVPTDVSYLLLSAFVSLVLAAPLMAVVSGGALWLAHQADRGLWPSSWPFLAQLGLALVVYELGSWTLHRLSHATVLFRLHSVHHSVRRLTWFNSIRAHPLDFLLSVTATSGPLLLLGVPDEVFAAVTVVGTVNMWLQHANIDTRTGWLDWLFVTPHIHRWHHSPLAEEQGKNLGAVLLVWDWAFGTRYSPAGRAPPVDVGPGVADFPDTFVHQLLAPFRRALWAEKPVESHAR